MGKIKPYLFTIEELLFIQKKQINKNVYVLFFIILFPIYYLAISYFRFMTYRYNLFIRLTIELFNWLFYSFVSFKMENIYSTNNRMFKQIFKFLLAQSLIFILFDIIFFSQFFPIISTIAYFVFFIIIMCIEFFKIWGLKVFIFLYNYMWLYFWIFYPFSYIFNFFKNQFDLIGGYIYILPIAYFCLTLLLPKIDPYKSVLMKFIQKMYYNSIDKKKKDGYDYFLEKYRYEILFRSYSGLAILDSNTFKIGIPFIVCTIGFIIFLTFGSKSIFESLIFSVFLFFPLTTSKTVFIFALSWAS